MSFLLQKEPFRKSHLERIAKLKSINFSSEETQNSLCFLEAKNIVSFDFDKPLNEISKSFSTTSFFKTIENILFSDMQLLLNNHENNINKLNNILLHEKIIQDEYNNILKLIQSNESKINELIDFYSDYLKDNRGFLIRNQILQTFLNKILISKDEKENLSNQTLFDETFFKMISKMNFFKENIEIIQKNSGAFSKTLLISIKEHHSLIDEMLNEKIVIYLKTIFRTKKQFDIKEYKKILSLIAYLHNKEQYLQFIINEYTQMRKKYVEEQLREKYLKMSSKNYDEIFKNLNEDFIFYFIKEFILINFIFDAPPIASIDQTQESKAINSIIEQDSIFNLFYLNEAEIENKEKSLAQLEELMKKICSFSKTKDLGVYLSNLNSILYVFEDLFFQHTQKVGRFYEVYKITLLSYFYTEKIDNLFKENNLEGISLKLSVIISNYKKSYSLLFKKISNETLKSLQKLKANLINYLTDSQVLLTNESIINQTIMRLIEEYTQIFMLYENYKIQKDEQEIANPVEHETYLYLVNFFNSEQIKNEKNIDILFKVINLLSLLISSLKKFDTINIKKNEVYLEELLDKTVELIKSTVLTQTKFEDGIRESISHEQTISLIEHLLEKSQLALMNVNFIKDYSVKDTLKLKLKTQLLLSFQTIMNTENDINFGGLTEEEFKNYLDVI